VGRCVTFMWCPDASKYAMFKPGIRMAVGYYGHLYEVSEIYRISANGDNYRHLIVEPISYTSQTCRRAPKRAFR